jgi:hypothetical protein
MNRDEERRLTLGLLSGHDAGQVREESLQRALDALRHEARRRRLVQSVSLVCAPVVVGLLLFLTAARWPRLVPPVALAPLPAARTASPSNMVIEPIDDQQLLALLSGKTVALVGPPGRERLLVFDAPGPSP